MDLDVAPMASKRLDQVFADLSELSVKVKQEFK
jgi:hypothetical protein